MKKPLEPGDLVAVKGERGRFVVKKLREDGAVDVFGGKSGYAMFRTFELSRLRRVKK